MNSGPNADFSRNGPQSQGISQAHGTPLKTILIAAAIAAMVFALDLLAPLGIAGGVPYVALVLCGWWFPDRSAVMYLAVAGSVLTIMGYFLSPEGGIDWVVFFNRALAILAIWSLAAFLWWAWRDRAPCPHQPMGETWLDRRPFHSMGSESFFVAVLVVVIVASSWGAITRIEVREKIGIEKSLKIALETSLASVRKKFETQKKAARFWAKDFQVRGAVVELLALPRDAAALINSLPQEDLRTRMTLLLERAHYRGYFVIGKDNINLASSRDNNIGVVSLLAKQEGFLARVWAGETLVSSPQVSDVPLKDTTGELVENLPTMFVVSPLIGAGGDIIAIFAFRLDPDEMFMPISHLGRFGDSGETYAFNRLGVMISESRFSDHFVQLGLTTSKHSDLNLEIRDPGVDMTLGGKPSLPREEQPLTRMAQSGIAGENGMDLEGYRDYRGAPVVGAWLWDDELGFGIASEISVEEAYASFHNTNYVIVAFAVMAVGVLMVLALVSSRTRKQIAVSEKKYRTSINSTSEGYWLADKSGRIVEVNQAFCQMLGHEPDEIIGKIPSEFVSDENREIIEKHAATIPTTTHRNYEVIFNNKLGKPVHAHISGTTIWDSKGKATGAFAFITDITESKKIEEALAQKSQIIETSIEIMGHGICVYSAEGIVVAFNSEFLRLAGLPLDYDPMGKNNVQILRKRAESGIFGDSDIEAIIQERQKISQGTTVQKRERRRADGTVFVYHRVPMPGGGYVATYTDITEIKQAEADLRKTKEEADKAKEEAEFANRSKTEFLSRMSHELRTPLNAVIGFSEVMMKESFGPIGNDKYVEYTEDINASGQHLLSLINDMLDLSKIEAGKVDLHEEAFNPVKVIQSCLNMIKGQASSQGLELATEIPDQLPPLCADRRLFKQIFLNLLSNAAKFTPEGGKITVKAWSQPGSGHVFQVIDTGIGVAIDDIPKILQPFTQIENFLTRKHQGTGLGLPLVKNLVELQGGSLDFQSEVGVGSTVTVRFPKERIVTTKGKATISPAAE